MYLYVSVYIDYDTYVHMFIQKDIHTDATINYLEHKFVNVAISNLTIF